MAEVRILSNELCNTMEYHNGKLSANMICADGNGKGPCAGDTGGGLMIRSSRDSERQVLAGIASWSTSIGQQNFQIKIKYIESVTLISLYKIYSLQRPYPTRSLY